MTVKSDFHQGVVTLTLARPERRNAIDDATAAALHEALRAATADDACRAIVLAAEGPVFCAGWDLAEIAAMRATGDRAAVEASFAANRRLLADLAAAPQPTIAAVQGGAMGFGLGLIARCDLALAARGAVVALPEIAHGVVPGIVMLDLLATLPRKVALDWLLSGAPVSAADALAAGLFSRLVDDAALAAETAALAAAIAAHQPAAVRETKALYGTLAAAPPEAAEEEAVRRAVDALLLR
ncbi:enoyl-CoA hydratase/isomerase family protein [Conexibacter sp. JD483]|uniref:enoyl-CoA hydratase/isomerase family protein n=1 Tax=unclassified Conexibacter TaxID=2627773 RepID=UPI0027178D6D|nr:MULTISPECIES: enoyl-CoA hydratase/isomerase family protein [unclassified Conexibacter]MDO8187696.1 enoyl-CoA hydratase/isomerase family protein [Conexibacter sp. CPCC 205706]MDO8199881.1 enoyl-CoA hydratase/isomerase family protein [Conexibacter sp. CPCC 205762]MDR9372240.1 enoyl-CoA hydratase/isomerase family protein [Conexibacter sp. JD483]